MGRDAGYGCLFETLRTKAGLSRQVRVLAAQRSPHICFGPAGVLGKKELVVSPCRSRVNTPETYFVPSINTVKVPSHTEVPSDEMLAKYLVVARLRAGLSVR